MRLPKLNMRARIGLLAGGVIITVVSTVAFTGTNTIIMPTSTADVQFLPVTPDTVKPEQCSGITVDKVITGSGTINGGNDNDLILAESPNSVITGGLGNDCIVIGEGLGSIDGGAGTNICIGGPSTVFANCAEIYNS